MCKGEMNSSKSSTLKTAKQNSYYSVYSFSVFYILHAAASYERHVKARRG